MSLRGLSIIPVMIKFNGSKHTAVERFQNKTNLKAEWEESEMEQSKCLLQGPRIIFRGLWT